MARPLPLKAYLALHGSNDTGVALQAQAKRPAGQVIWALCETSQQAAAMAGLRKVLLADGDAVHLVVTQTDPESSDRGPQGRKQTRAFLAHWRPDLCLWVGDRLDPLMIDEITQARRPLMGIDMTKSVLRQSGRNWIPGLTRAVLGLFDRIITTDDVSAALIKKAGIPSKRITALGPLEETPTVLPYREADRKELTRAMGTRPAWLVAAAGIEEVETIAIAHNQASRRAHRLLLIVSLRDSLDGPAMAQALRDKGFDVALRSDDTEPSDTTSVYVMDQPDELGLCYRLAPITYLAGSLSGTPCRDPYEAAALGSAVLHGPAIAPWQSRIALLSKAGGCMSLESASALGDAVETLLAADKVASIAHAAWDVTSRGADMTERLAAAVQTMLDESVG